MKILYVSVYKDGTGYGNAAIENILAMDAVGIDVVPRHTKLNKNHIQLPKRIEELEKQSEKGCNINVQHMLPHMMDYDGRFDKNIALFASETSDFRFSTWKKYLNKMDEVWVINRQMCDACEKSGVKKPIRIIPHAVDVEKFNRSYDIPHEALNKQRDKFTFYTIAEYNPRKNFKALLAAFHLTFGNKENVQLIIKTNSDKIQKDIDEVKSNIKLYGSRRDKYKDEIVITEPWTKEQIYGLHMYSDCFISTSYGEAWCLPAMDALGFGKTPIVPNSTGFRDYVNPQNGFLINCRETPVMGMNDSFPMLYTAYERWWEVNIDDLISSMKFVYDNRGQSIMAHYVSNGISTVKNFDYQCIGQIIKNRLCQENKKSIN